MNATTRNAVSAYSQVGIETGIAGASPHKLIAMLFEGAILSVAAGKVHMQRNEIAAKGKAISQAIAIIDEGLKVSLDEKVGGELAQNLKALYEYMCQRLLVANLKNETVPLDEVSRLLSELKGAWDTIGKPQNVVGTVAAPQPESVPQQRASLSYGKA
ncbi:MAG TPA: flagellar export chaperone FliS [Sulfuricella sp.]|nr:flagellar export chaperone FliS [Sulfuricella sp.]